MRQLALVTALLCALPGRAADQSKIAVLEFDVAPRLKIDRIVFSDLARSAVTVGRRTR